MKLSLISRLWFLRCGHGPDRSRQPRQSRGRAAPRCRPTQEAFEVRLAPAVITVTTLADESTAYGLVSLREAILAANTDASVDGSVAGNGADTIVFAPGIAGGTINLSAIGATTQGPSAFGITSPITIAGTGETLTRGGAGPAFRLFLVDTGGNLTLQNLTLSNGRAQGGNGGANGSDGSAGGGGGGGRGGRLRQRGVRRALGGEPIPALPGPAVGSLGPGGVCERAAGRSQSGGRAGRDPEFAGVRRAAVTPWRSRRPRTGHRVFTRITGLPRRGCPLTASAKGASS